MWQLNAMHDPGLRGGKLTDKIEKQIKYELWFR